MNINLSQEIKAEVSKYKSCDDLLRHGGISTEALDRQAFGFSDSDIKTLMPEQLHIKWKDDYENVLWEVNKSGLTKQAWARKVDLSQPIDVSYEKNKFYIEDGHHRYYAAKVLKKPLNVNLSIEMNPIKAIAPNLGYDEFHCVVYKQVMGLNEIINGEINKLDEVRIPAHNKSYLYHVTNINKLDEIKRYGLLPQFGDTIKNAYSDYYNFDGEEYEDDEEKPQDMDFEGILFFSEEPILGYSQTMQQNFKWEEALVCVVVKNDTIYHKISDYPKFTDYQGKVVGSINHMNVYDLPIFIETNDWFSFEEQECKYLLYGEDLKSFIGKYFPNVFNRYK
jgi:hypothetical protein